MHDNAKAIGFLKQWAPEGPWALTAINPDKKDLNTHTFWPGSVAQLEQWLERYNGKWNIYFHVNPVRHSVKKKARREDIKSLDWLHVDIDPRPGEELEEERERALGLLTHNRPEHIPQPTVIIFSGGGFQAFWKLDPTVEINGDVGIAEDVKRYNQQLEITFGGDNCHNIDRVMRLPGSVNIPDAKKRKKGRVKALAELVEWNEEALYTLTDFTKAEKLQMPSEGFSNTRVEVGGNIERVMDLSELDEWGVSDRVKIIIAQGRHPDEHKEKDDSRSAWLFDAVCQLVRAGVPDDTIFSLITDPDWGISESVLEMKRNAQKYALKQIASAKEWVIDPLLMEFNQKYAVIEDFGGKCVVITERWDEAIKRPRISKMSFDNFRNAHMHRKVQIGVNEKGAPITMQLGKWWLLNEERSQFENVTFLPMQHVEGAYNLWRGFAYNSNQGDCTLFLEHVRKNICAGRDDLYQYVVKWMARAIQQPASAGETAIVMRGGQGTGKSLFASTFGKLFGRHFMTVSNPSHLVGNFNSHLRDLIVLFADEAFYAKDKKHTSVLKTLVTSDNLIVESKGVDVETAPNFTHLIMASNDLHVIPAGEDERRFLVLDVAPNNQKDRPYFRAIRKQMEDGGYEALLHYLNSVDLSDFDVTDFPLTDALREQKLLTLTTEEDWWYSRLQSGSITSQVSGWPEFIRTEQVMEDYVQHATKFNASVNRGTATKLGIFMKRVCPGMENKLKYVEVQYTTTDGFTSTKRERKACYFLPTLEQARAQWEDIFGPTEWSEVVEEEEIEDALPLGDVF